MLSALVAWTRFMVVYHVACALFQLLDHKAWLQRYKAFRGGAGLPGYGDMLPRVLFNPTCIMLPTMVALFPLAAGRDGGAEPSAVTSWLALCTLAPLLHEVAFYMAHRFVLHSPRGVARFGHKLHHAPKAHCALSAMYVASFDFVLQIMLPYALPLLVLRRARMLGKAHASWLLALGSLGGLNEHSGYNFAPDVWSLDTRIHAMHHVFYSCSFADGVGTPGLLDHVLHSACGGVGAPALAARKLVARMAPSPAAPARFRTTAVP